jgi:hypothetical protein
MKETLKSIETTVVREVGGVTKTLEQQAVHYRQSVLQRFPFLIIGLSTFGLVAVLYGFEKIIDSIPVLADNPLYVLAVGLLSLAITGTLYKKLQ